MDLGKITPSTPTAARPSPSRGSTPTDCDKPADGYAGSAEPPVPSPAPPPPPSPAQPVVSQAAEPAAPVPPPEDEKPTREPHFLPEGDLGAGFPARPAGKRSWGEKLHNFLAHQAGDVYDFALRQVLARISNTTQRGVGVDVEGLLSVERTLYRALAGGGDGYEGAPAHGKSTQHAAPPVFQALADGQAAYVNLGPGRPEEAEHLMRMFANLPLEKIETLHHPDPNIERVRQHLVEKARANEFPIFVDTDGKFDESTPTEFIATESIASIARRENSLGSDFPDPRMYYRWLVTRIDSNYRKLDPWLFMSEPKVHDSVVTMKSHLTPPWLKSDNLSDPFGSTPDPRETQKAYLGFMELAGAGAPPTWDTLTNIADATIGLDRDLISGIQTYWIKLLKEVAPAQRESIMTPVSRAWTKLNALGPESPEFSRVSPENSPYIELIDRHNGKTILERYDRSLALGQAVDHLISGLGLSERNKFMDILMVDMRANQEHFEAREMRLRERLGANYRGLNVAALISGAKTIHDPEVKAALNELKKSAAAHFRPAPNEQGEMHEMTPEYAEIVRHRDIMDWLATRHTRYGDIAFQCLTRTNDFSKSPLILSAYYEPEVNPPGGVTPLPAGPSPTEVWGKPVAGQEPIPTSWVFEGGGGKGFAFVECLRQARQALESANGQVKVEEFVGNSAGALTAGLLAAGYNPDELGEVLKKLDFKKFYSDYLWLSGGVDPKVRGLNRTGIFSQQKMYKTLATLIKDKCPVQGRPVLFRDLPFKLKVTSTAINTDLPPDLLKGLNIGPEGQIVFSSDTTPNMDVAAAMCCSAAIPGFFDAPQIQISQNSDLLDDHDKRRIHRMQLVDGGVVNNFPVARAGQEGEKSFLLTLPAYAQAPDPNGGPPISLSTLNFDSSNIGAINAYNQQQYQSFGPQAAQLIQECRKKGYQRAVVALNLSDLKEQPAPIVQGHTRKETKKLLELADKAGLPHMSASEGGDVIKRNMEEKERTFLERQALNLLLDKNDALQPGVFCGPKFHILEEEAAGIADMLGSVLAANLTAPAHLERHLFEKD